MSTELVVGHCTTCNGSGLHAGLYCVHCLTGRRLAAYHDWCCTPEEKRIVVEREGETDPADGA